MKRWMKVTLGLVGGLLVLLVVAGFVVAARLDGIVKSTVESQGSQQLSLATTLDKANVSILGSSATLDGLTIDNPEGYDADHLFEMGQINLDVSYSGLTSDPVKVGAINVVSPKLVLERKPGSTLAQLGNINIRDLLNNLSSEGDTLMLTIEKLNISGATVEIRPHVEGLDEVYSVTLPELAMENIGTADMGATGVELGRVLGEMSLLMARRAAASEDLDPRLQALLAGDIRQTIAQAGDQLRSEAASRLQAELDKQIEGLPEGLAQDLVDGNFESLQAEATSRAKDEVNSQLEEGKAKVQDELGDAARKGIGSLLGGNKKDDEKDPE